MKFIKRLHNKDVNLATILSIFIAWRIFLFLPFFITLGILTTQKNFLGGGMDNYLHVPYLWGWANFDGEHYLSIARYGYQPLTYFFFPVYPMLIRTLAEPFVDSLVTYLYSGLLISHISLVFALWGLWKLLSLDYKKRLSLIAILLMLLFPTAFFFAGVYTESLFLALVVWCFYFARLRNWILVAILGGLATATRLVGIVIIPALFFEWLSIYKSQDNRQRINALICIVSVFIGALLYMLFLERRTGDPLEFFHSVGIYGEQRSNNLILLPQVFYRYVIKIIPNIPLTSFPSIFTPYLEFVIAVIFGIVSVYSFFKLRASYAFYLIGGYILPTLSGSFSSLPRYVLILFPGFIILAMGVSRLPKLLQMLIFIGLAVSLTVSQALFVRGYWLS